MAFTSSYTPGLIQQSEYIYATPNITIPGNISGSITSTASFGTYLGDGSQLIGVLTTASVSLNTITFTKGDGSTFPITVDTGSGGGGGGVPSGTVSGSAQITALGFVTSSATASFVLNSQTSSMSVATASYVETSQTASYVLQAVSASYAPTAPGILSSSAQIATEISGAFSADSASFSTRVTTNETNIGSLTTATASYITNSQTSSMSVATASYAITAQTASYVLQAVSASYAPLILPSGILSGSAQIASDISGSFTAPSASFSIRVTANEVVTAKTLISSSAQIASDISGSFTAPSASFSTRITTNETDISTLTAATASYLTSLPAGVLSGSAQIATEISGAFGAPSASFSTRVTTLEGAGTPTPTFIASGSTSASAAPDTGVVVEHSGSTAFSVIGDVGTLFSVDDDLTGTLFSANDISGFPVLQADATGEVYLGKSPQSLYTTAVISSTTAATTHSLCTLSTSSYDGAFFEYTAQSASNARAGNIMSTWNGTDIVYAETTTADIGRTSDLTTEVIISGSTARLVAYGANAGYKIKTIIKAI